MERAWDTPNTVKEMSPLLSPVSSNAKSKRTTLSCLTWKLKWICSGREDLPQYGYTLRGNSVKQTTDLFSSFLCNTLHVVNKIFFYNITFIKYKPTKSTFSKVIFQFLNFDVFFMCFESEDSSSGRRLCIHVWYSLFYIHLYKQSCR
jgi:hypothetical protein